MTPTSTQVREALEIWDEYDRKGWTQLHVTSVVLSAAVRAWLDLFTEDGGLNPERLEAAAKTVYDSGLPTASFTKTGRTVPFEESMSPHQFRAATRAAILAYLGEPR